MEITLIVIAFVLSLLGCVLVFVPGVPGPLVSWAGPLVYFVFSVAPPEEALSLIGVTSLVVSGVLAVLTLVFDFLSSWWGAKKFGATWRGGLGALIGAILGPILLSPLGGILGALLGLLLGPLVGAVVGELLGGNDWRKSARAGWGTLLGTLAATVVKLFYCLCILLWLCCAVIF
ncbi:MAG: DUF456 domain-containing protein [Candidatus Spyradosoma sp.]